MVDAVVWDTLLDICGPHEAQHGTGWAVGEHNIGVYCYDGLIMGRKPIWVQGTLKTPMRMFEQLRLYTDLGNSFNVAMVRGVFLRRSGRFFYPTDYGSNVRRVRHQNTI